MSVQIERQERQYTPGFVQSAFANSLITILSSAQDTERRLNLEHSR